MQDSNALTLEDLERIALENNPTLAQAQTAVEGAAGKWVQARLYPNPTISYNGAEIGNEGSGGQHGVNFQQLIITGGKLELSQHAAAHEIERLEHQSCSPRCKFHCRSRFTTATKATFERRMPT